MAVEAQREAKHKYHGPLEVSNRDTNISLVQFCGEVSQSATANENAKSYSFLSLTAFQVAFDRRC